MGLGKQHARARLERVEALHAWQPTGTTIYVDDRVASTPTLPVIDAAAITAHAARLPATLQLTLCTPLRIKAQGTYLQSVDLFALVQSLCWRLTALSIFHSDHPWTGDHQALLDQARAIQVRSAQVQWWDWERTSTRHATPRTMKLGGIVGTVVLDAVTSDLRALLVMGTLTHIGKACVFGHGGYTVQPRANQKELL
ncbi:MAG: CRISPR system precrRNA processing endoribonuclease RAMP protein Cas6 [Chloroflexaceae bacterium]|nr:CRISPR system precrRNA processing endoribonuclease RAMP protein Cas6 [Chloroflexaceae bacterium]